MVWRAVGAVVWRPEYCSGDPLWETLGRVKLHAEWNPKELQVTIIDNVSCCFTGLDNNDRVAVGAVMAELQKLQGCKIVLHHPAKGGGEAKGPPGRARDGLMGVTVSWK